MKIGASALAGIEYSYIEGICSPAYTVLKPKIEIYEDFYKFYFKKTTRVTLGNEYFDSALSSDCFLGYEAAAERK